MKVFASLYRVYTYITAVAVAAACKACDYYGRHIHTQISYKCTWAHNIYKYMHISGKVCTSVIILRTNKV